MASMAAPFAGASILALREFLGERMAPLLQRPFPELLLVTDRRLSFEDSLSDAVVHRVLCAVLESTDENIDDLSFEFGRFLFDFLLEEACFQQAIHCVSNTFTGFARVLNRVLDNLYQALGCHNSALPEALIQEVESGSFLLGGIAPATPTAAGMLFLGAYKGMLDVAATQVFGIQVKFSDPNVMQMATGRQRRSCRVSFTCVRPMMPTPPPAAAGALLIHGDDEKQDGRHIMGLDPETFERMFPFHFALDLDMRVLQAGEALQRVLPELQLGTHIQDVLTFQSPRVLWSPDCLEGLLQNDMSVKVVLGSIAGPRLCGGLHRVQQMRHAGDSLVAGCTSLLFIGTPLLERLEDMETFKLFVSDFPPHDTAAEQLLVATAKQARAAKALKAAHQSNFELRETLAETLAFQEQGLGDQTLNVDSAGNTLLQLLDSLLMGGQVDAQQVIVARNALLKAGENLWRPLDVHWDQAVGGDREVNKALATLLGTPHNCESLDEDGPERFDDGDEATLQQLEAMSSGHSQPRGSVRSESPGTQLMPPSTLGGVSGIGRLRGSFEAVRVMTSRTSAHKVNVSESLPAPLAAEANTSGRSSGNRLLQASASRQGRGVGAVGPESLDGGGRKAPIVLLEDVNPMFEAKVQATSGSAAPQQNAEAASCSTHSQETNAAPGLLCGGLIKSMLKKLRSKGRATDDSRGSCKVSPSGIPHLDTSPAPAPAVALAAPEPAMLPPLQLSNAAAASTAPAAAASPTTVPAAPAVPSPDDGLLDARASEDHAPPAAKQMLHHRLLASSASSRRRKMSIDNTPPLIRLLREQPADEMTSLLAAVNEWQYDSFALDAVTAGHPLSCLAFHLMERQGLIKTLKLDAIKLARFLTAVEEGYGAGQYHCRIHACDVLRTLHAILHRGGVLASVAKRTTTASAAQSLPGVDEEADADSAVTLLTFYLAAVVHDYDHRGVNNDFLIKSTDALALTYNDHSPLENHHVAAAFTLMHNERFAFMSKLSKKMRADVRRDVIDLVLATDMKQHFALTGSFTSKFEKPPPAQFEMRVSDSGAPIARSTSQVGGRYARDDSKSVALTFSPGGSSGHTLKPAEVWDREMEMLAFKMALKAADLGHLTSSLEVHKKWVARLEQELFMQGDRERALGLPISPLMDRNKSGIQKSQTGFFAVVAQPMYTSFTQTFPQSKPLLTNLHENLSWWKQVEGVLHNK